MKRARILYSEAELAWLEANRDMIISDYHAAFVEGFGRADVKLSHLHGLRKRKGWKVGRAPHRYVGRGMKFSEAELRWLRENCSLPFREYGASFRAAFGRADSDENLRGLRKRQGWQTGRSGRFEKGQISHNKGRRCRPGEGGRHPNACRTQFRKGARPHTYRGPGHERIDAKDGYVIMIVEEPNPWTGGTTRPVHKHRYLWEKANGPLPADHVLKCLDSDKTNTAPSNWEAIPRGVLSRLNGGRHKKVLAYDEAPEELKPAVMAAAKLNHRIRHLRQKAVAE